jgi:hypothetical protein
MECTREHQLSLYRPIIPVSAPNEAVSGYGLSHMKKKKGWIRKYTVDRFRSDPDLCLNPCGRSGGGAEALLRHRRTLAFRDWLLIPGSGWFGWVL